MRAVQTAAMLDIVVDVAAGDWPPTSDWQALSARCVGAAVAASPYAELADMAALVEISVRFSDNAEVQALNRDYRHKDKPTNVLSFPMVAPDMLEGLANSDDGEILLGDIVLAYGVTAQEAQERGLDLAAHVAHLIVHATLHLLGYDHIVDDAADVMEALETQVLATLGLADPYGSDAMTGDNS